MRVQNIAIRDGRILKQYELTDFQRESVKRYFDEYVAWIRTLGFKVPETKLLMKDNTLIFNQAYVEGVLPTAADWLGILDCIIRQPDEMLYGLDANPLNFIFDKDEVYFIDFYPLLISDDIAFLASQFSYNQSIIKARYFNKWSVVVCFLNRIRKVDVHTFRVCLGRVGGDIIPRLNDVPGRDVLRLASAMGRDDKEYAYYYAESATSELSLSRPDIEGVVAQIIQYQD